MQADGVTEAALAVFLRKTGASRARDKAQDDGLGVHERPRDVSRDIIAKRNPCARSHSIHVEPGPLARSEY
jgi:hypothetical protein